MSEDIDNGGSAFPSELFEQPGMSLRDYFAAAALTGCIRVCTDSLRNQNESIQSMFARKSYEIADAMLAARKEGA
jgi:hypothetical protein